MVSKNVSVMSGSPFHADVCLHMFIFLLSFVRVTYLMVSLLIYLVIKPVCQLNMYAC